MKISGIKKIKAEQLLQVFEDFKNELISTSIKKFSYDDFVDFINRPENENKYLIVAYKWHRNELQLESEHYGCRALNVFNLFLAFSDSNKRTVLDDDGKKIKIINKTGKNLFEFINL